MHQCLKLTVTILCSFNRIWNGIRCTNAYRILFICPILCLNFFFGTKHNLVISFSLEMEIDGQMLVKTLIKYPTHVRVFSLIVTCFNKMDMGDYQNKNYWYLGTEKS